MMKSTNSSLRDDDDDDDDGDDGGGDDDDDALPVVVAVPGKAQAFAVYIYTTIHNIYIYTRIS